jgi:hypothetical protein
VNKYISPQKQYIKMARETTKEKGKKGKEE